MPKKTILPPKRDRELFFSDSQWAKLRRYIPEPLPPEDEARLREDIRAACSRLLAEQARHVLGRRTAAAMQKPGKGQPALLERLANHLRAAATVWREIKQLPPDSADVVVMKLLRELPREQVEKMLGVNALSELEALLDDDSLYVRRGVIYDDRLSDIRQYDALEAMARDIERRLAGIRKLGEAKRVDDPWPIFVRKVARCFREIDLRPTATGRVYDEGGKPTWFQEFMAALDKNLLGYKSLIGIDPEGKQYERDPKAFHAEIAKVIGGYRNSGKARKQITGH
jgi:hypothetical protein